MDESVAEVQVEDVNMLFDEGHSATRVPVAAAVGAADVDTSSIVPNRSTSFEDENDEDDDEDDAFDNSVERVAEAETGVGDVKHVPQHSPAASQSTSTKGEETHSHSFFDMLHGNTTTSDKPNKFV